MRLATVLVGFASIAIGACATTSPNVSTATQVRSPKRPTFTQCRDVAPAAVPVGEPVGDVLVSSSVLDGFEELTLEQRRASFFLGRIARDSDARLWYQTPGLSYTSLVLLREHLPNRDKLPEHLRGKFDSFASLFGVHRGVVHRWTGERWARPLGEQDLVELIAQSPSQPDEAFSRKHAAWLLAELSGVPTSVVMRSRLAPHERIASQNVEAGLKRFSSGDLNSVAHWLQCPRFDGTSPIAVCAKRPPPAAEPALHSAPFLRLVLPSAALEFTARQVNAWTSRLAQMAPGARMPHWVLRSSVSVGGDADPDGLLLGVGDVPREDPSSSLVLLDLGHLAAERAQLAALARRVLPKSEVSEPLVRCVEDIHQQRLLGLALGPALLEAGAKPSALREEAAVTQALLAPESELVSPVCRPFTLTALGLSWQRSWQSVPAKDVANAARFAQIVWERGSATWEGPVGSTRLQVLPSAVEVIRRLAVTEGPGHGESVEPANPVWIAGFERTCKETRGVRYVLPGQPRFKALLDDAQQVEDATVVDTLSVVETLMVDLDVIKLP